MNKRSFLKKASVLGLLPFTYPKFFEPTHEARNILESSPVAEEHPKAPLDFWQKIRSQYDLTTDYINLESGYYNIIPKPTLEKLQANMKRVNIEGAHYMRTKLDDDRKETTRALADFMGVSTNNLVITRNTTESLDLVIAGYPWQKGDHVIYALQDYGAMKVMFEQVVKRHELTQDIVSVPNHPKDDDEIVALYESQIKPNTKMIMVCHMINITGHILPIRKICDMAHSHGVEVLVDGAHCVGHFDFDLKALNCDYYGSSLHKWLAAPLGNGLLYIDSKRIAPLWPLLADYIEDRSNILRLNHLGTHPAYITLGINDAINYLNTIGLARKEERLRFLRTYWMDALKDVPNVVINTPWEPHRACGIGNIGLSNLSPGDMAQRLLAEHGVFTVAIDYANVHGCRITPNVFTTTAELDRFIGGVKALAQG